MTTTHADPARALVEEIVRAGVMITGLVEDLLDGLPEDAFPGESHVDVLLGMLAGSIRPATEAAGDEAVDEMIALLGALSERILTDLHAAVAVARARA